MIMSDRVRSAAAGQWDAILRQVCGLSENETIPSRKGLPCPYCAGTDRYEFKSAENGHYLCRGCGAGDGWSMVMKILHCDFAGAVRHVAEWLHLAPEDRETSSPPARQSNPTQYDRIASKAQAIWQRTQSADCRHPYLVKKHLPASYFRQHRDCLAVPVFSPDRQMVNLQFIDPHSNKRFLKGGRTEGCFTSYGNRSSWSVYVCEGVADALSIYIQYHRMAVAAFSVGNIGPVAMALRRQLPGNRLVLFLDNDKPTDKRPWRPGAAAFHYHHWFDAVVIPPEGCDASDLYTMSTHHG